MLLSPLMTNILQFIFYRYRLIGESSGENSHALCCNKRHGPEIHCHLGIFPFLNTIAFVFSRSLSETDPFRRHYTANKLLLWTRESNNTWSLIFTATVLLHSCCKRCCMGIKPLILLFLLSLLFHSVASIDHHAAARLRFNRPFFVRAGTITKRLVGRIIST